ncbi:LOW QUALITY PROTEIN: hypothetical protein Cgig2_019174 [Carnegiea gigantea]|uniref:Reverse transcriptase zinc-binding domain-containing protein n=1 Tax=Carnegiea gigantea TaxID=171969 RepID=A0A9Q1JYD8_9CARY|nr:LOW QUALITY PROTEIN: hypothetical protein Cgig2_019174 [Carnegiea gigantea]
MLFPSAEVRHLDEKLLDHLPIKVMLYAVLREQSRGRRNFKFKNMWALEDGCQEVVEHAWNREVGAGSGTVLVAKLQTCQQALLRDITERNNILSEIGNLRCKEEAQRAKVDFLKYGKTNTRWFHARTSMRRSTNAICQIECEDGLVATEEEEVQQVIVDYFPNLGGFAGGLANRERESFSNPIMYIMAPDRLVWHYSSNGPFSVCSAYHFIHSLKFTDLASSRSYSMNSIWNFIWKLNVLPRIKVFLWRVGVSALPTKANIGHRVPHFTMSYAICGAVEESDTYILLNYPMATSIWEASKFDKKL